jgi:hypothetical protein
MIECVQGKTRGHATNRDETRSLHMENNTVRSGPKIQLALRGHHPESNLLGKYVKGISMGKPHTQSPSSSQGKVRHDRLHRLLRGDAS